MKRISTISIKRLLVLGVIARRRDRTPGRQGARSSTQRTVSFVIINAARAASYGINVGAVSHERPTTRLHQAVGSVPVRERQPDRLGSCVTTGTVVGTTVAYAPVVNTERALRSALRRGRHLERQRLRHAGAQLLASSSTSWTTCLVLDVASCRQRERGAPDDGALLMRRRRVLASVATTDGGRRQHSARTPRPAGGVAGRRRAAARRQQAARRARRAGARAADGRSRPTR